MTIQNNKKCVSLFHVKAGKWEKKQNVFFCKTFSHTSQV